MDRGRAFYEGLFGWSFETGPSGKGFVIDGSNVGGGMHSGDAGASPYVFFAVEDIEAAIARVRELGGEAEDVDVEGGADSIDRSVASCFAATTRGRRSACTNPPRPLDAGEERAYPRRA